MNALELLIELLKERRHMVYIRNNIALDIEWTIYKNRDPNVLVDQRSTPGAVPYLREDGLLPIREIPIGGYIQGSDENDRVTLEAVIDYKSVLKDEYEVIYSLSVWYDTERRLTKEEELRSWKLPWDI